MIMEEKNENVELNNEQSVVEPVVEPTVSTETAEPVVEPTVPVESGEPATPVVEPAPVVETNDLPAGDGMASGNDVAAPVTESKTETMEPIMYPEKSAEMLSRHLKGTLMQPAQTGLRHRHSSERQDISETARYTASSVRTGAVQLRHRHRKRQIQMYFTKCSSAHSRTGKTLRLILKKSKRQALMES